MRDVKAKNRFGIFKAGILFTLMAMGLCAGILIGANLNDVVEYQVVEQQRFTREIVGDRPIAGDTSGLLYFMVYPHQAAPATPYASNLTNASAYEYTEEVTPPAANAEMVGETPHSTTFDFVVKFRLNDTVNYNVSGATYEPSWVYMNITVDFDFASDIAETTMDLILIDDNPDFVYYHGYINNSGSGYQITHNEKFNVTSLKLSAIW